MITEPEHTATEPRQLSELREESRPVLPPDQEPGRRRAIIVSRSKWVNGTVLHYYFFDQETDGSTVTLADGRRRFFSWVGPGAQREAVRTAFREWKAVGIGLEFQEVTDRSEAELRVGFMQVDGSWSYVGRDVLGIGANDRTMNYGWDLTSPYGRTTALHEIGHAIGMPHEHQNPFSGLVWDEPRVYSAFSGPPNNWSRDKIEHNILRKLDPAEVEGSPWDPDSVMEYEFPAGVIKEPARYRTGLVPAGGLSPVDRQWALKWYPGTGPGEPPALEPFASQHLALGGGEQRDFTLRPAASREYEVGTFGAADTVMVLFEDVNGGLRHLASDDDSGTDRNAHVKVKLFQGRRYVLRVRLYSSWKSGETAVMYW